jgi:pilus assembly protein CpaC
MTAPRFASFRLQCFLICLSACLVAAPSFGQALVGAQTPPASSEPSAAGVRAEVPGHLSVTVDKSIVLEMPAGARRVSVASGDLAEAVVVSSTEVMINGKAPGTTSLVVWDAAGRRSIFDLHVRPGRDRLEAIRAQLEQELPGQAISISQEGADVFVTGTAVDLVSADRAVMLAGVLGKVVDLLHVAVPKSDRQVLLRVRFANVDRTASFQLGMNLFSTNPKLTGATSTGQFGGQPAVDISQGPAQTTLSQLLNIFLYRADLNIGAVIQALESKQLAQILAEPNLLTTSGHEASFLAGGQFPYPTLQGGGNGVGQITIQFRDFGIRLNFRPTVTVRGTIRLDVEPEVSSLDPANGLTISGYTIPGLDIQRVQTQVELASGQSFVIAGLLNNQVTQTINKIPGLSSLPIFGKLFQSRALLKNNSELLVIVTPEIVEPIDAGQKVPSLTLPMPFPAASPEGTRQPPASHTTPTQPVPATIPIELLRPPAAAEPAPLPSGGGFKPAPMAATPSTSPAPSSDSKP